MTLSEAILQALQTAWSHNLRSFFTLLGIIVSVGFLVAVVAVIQGMNAYVRERIAGAIVGVNAFQIRRDPIQVGFIDDEAWKKIQRRPIIAPEDVAYVERAVPDAQAISLQSGWPTPMADVQWRNRTVGDVLVFGVTPPFVVVQDYAFAAGAPFTDVDQRQRRLVAVLGFDVADKLFGAPDLAIGSAIRVRGAQLTIKGVIAKKGTVLGQSWDGFVMLPLTTFEALYGRRQTTVISVVWRRPYRASKVESGSMTNPSQDCPSTVPFFAMTPLMVSCAPRTRIALPMARSGAPNSLSATSNPSTATSLRCRWSTSVNGAPAAKA